MHAVNDRIMSGKVINQRPLTYDFMMHDYNTYCVPVVIDNPDVRYQRRRRKSCPYAYWERLLERILRLFLRQPYEELLAEFRGTLLAVDDVRRRKPGNQLCHPGLT